MVLVKVLRFWPLENLDLAPERGAPCSAEIIGYGIPPTTFTSRNRSHQASERDKQWSGLLSRAYLWGDVDLLNAHGTATVLTMRPRARPISALFNGVPVSSTKSLMGHLGAAGAIEAVFVCLRFTPISSS